MTSNSAIVYINEIHLDISFHNSFDACSGQNNYQILHKVHIK